MKRKLLFLAAALLSFCSLESWATDYEANVYVESGNSAMGLVYAAGGDTYFSDDLYKGTYSTGWTSNEEKLGTDFTMYIYAKPNDGYQFVGWEPIRNVKSIGDATQPNTSVAAEVYDIRVDNKTAYLVANFAPFEYNFYFYKDLEATADKEENVEYGKSVNLPQYTTEGKTLLGWRDMEYGHYYEPTATMKADIVNEGNEIKLLALWDKPAEVTLNESGLATYSSAVDVVIATSGVKAYCADIDEENDETIILSETKGRIPAGTGIILYGEPGTTVEFNYATEDVKAASIVNNYLKPTTLANGNLATCQELGDKDEWHYYALGPNAEFLKYTGNSFVHNRAYFVIVDNKTAAKALKIVFDDATAIKSVATEKQTGTRKFIENGKVVIEKNGVKYSVMGIRK